jgi:integrase
LTLRLGEIQRGERLVPVNQTIGEYLAEWLGSLGVQQLEAATVSWYRQAVERHIIPVLGAVKLTALTSSMIETFLAEKAANGRLDGAGGLGPASLRRLQVTLHKALDAAVRHRLLTVNPVDFADKPKVPRRDVTETVWTPEHMTTFLAATKGTDLHPLWHAACWTGLRRSELAGLQWGDIDLERGVLSVKRARTQVDGRTVLKGPKSATSRRSIDLDDQTVSVLKKWRATQNQKRLKVGEAWDKSEWVFTDNLGQPWRPDGITRRFVKAAKKAGLPPTDIKGLRHAHATALLKAGVHPKVVQERLGHSSILVTMDIYSSVLPGMQKEAVEKLVSMMGEH